MKYPTKLEFVGILLEIVKRLPYHACTQVDTFAIVDDLLDFDTKNLGKSFDDYLLGTFWSRSWENSGAVASDLSKDYPIVAIEQKTIQLENVFSKEKCYKFWINVLDIPDCEDCKAECKRSVDQIDCDVTETLQSILNELSKYHWYKFAMVGDTEASFAWLSENYVAANIDDFQVQQQLMDLKSFIPEEPAKIMSVDFGLKDGARAVNISLTLCTCDEVSKELDYSSKITKQITQPNCEAC